MKISNFLICKYFFDTARCYDRRFCVGSSCCLISLITHLQKWFVLLSECFMVSTQLPFSRKTVRSFRNSFCISSTDGRVLHLPVMTFLQLRPCSPLLPNSVVRILLHPRTYHSPLRYVLLCHLFYFHSSPPIIFLSSYKRQTYNVATQGSCVPSTRFLGDVPEKFSVTYLVSGPPLSPY